MKKKLLEVLAGSCSHYITESFRLE